MISKGLFSLSFSHFYQLKTVVSETTATILEIEPSSQQWEQQSFGLSLEVLTGQ
jgi:hypothetical protein